MTPPVRVLLSTDTAGGVWDFTVTLAEGLVADGHHVLLAVIGAPSEAQIARLPEELTLECRNDPLEWHPASWQELGRTAAWLARVARVWKADVVHLGQMTYPALAHFPAPVVVTVHSDVCSWFSEVRGAPPPTEWHEYVRLVQRGLRTADAVTAPSSYQGRLVHRHFGIHAEVIHNAAPAPGDSLITPDAPLLLTAGRAWDAAKGIAVLDEALLRLGDDRPAAHLLGETAGPGGASYSPRALRAEGHLPREETDRWMARATIYAAPAFYEPFGLAPLEAGLRGCALLLSDIGSFRELWDGCARFVPRGDAGALATAIQELAGDPDVVARLGAAARDRATERFTPERFIASYRRAYRALLEGATPVPEPAPARGLLN